MKLAFALKGAIRALAKGRAYRVAIKQQRVAAHAAVLETAEGCHWALLDADYKDIDKIIKKELEPAIRERAIRIYKRAIRIFGAADKKHWKGITIKDYTVVVVGPEVDLLEWVQDNLPILVEQKINMKAFESLVKTGNIPAEIAWVEKEPRAQIASKL